MIGDTRIFMASSFGVVGLITWWAAQLLMRDGGQRMRERLRGPEAQRPGVRETRESWIGGWFHRIGQASAMPFMPKNQENQSALRRQLGYAGIYSASAIRSVIGCKVLLLVGGVMAGYAAGRMMDNLMLGLSVGGLVGYLLPTMWLKRRISLNRRALEMGLADALDLLVVCVEAGLTVDAAMQRVGQELALAHPNLARELEITHMETRVGLARSEALRNLGKRTGSEPLRSLATMMVQAERFGTSIAASLRIHAETMRVNRQHRAEEMAAKAAVKLTFPVVLFIFPAILIVLAGPAAIGLFKSALFAE